MEENKKLYQPGRELLTAFCGVCGAPSTNRRYYGAVSCYSCRVFFQRGISRVYKCIRRNNACEINHEKRKFCRACRFKRCLEVGMIPSRVGTNRTDRTGDGKNKCLKEKSKEGTVSENVVEHRKKNDSFNPNHEVNDDGKETTEDAMEMPILPDSDLEAVLNSLSSEGSLTTSPSLTSDCSLPSPLTSMSSASPLADDCMETIRRSSPSNPNKSTPEGELHEIDQLTLSTILDMNESDQLIMNVITHMDECNNESAAILKMNVDLSSNLNEFDQTKTNTEAILNLDDPSPLSANIKSNNPSAASSTCSDNKSLKDASNCNEEEFTVNQLYAVKLEHKIRTKITEFVQNFDNSKAVKEITRKGKSTKKREDKITKNPDVKLFVEEDFLLHDAVERRNLYGNMVLDFAVKYAPEVFTKHFESRSTYQMADFLQGISYATAVLQEMDNLLIPDGFGKFAKGFVSTLYQYTSKADCHFQMGLYFYHGSTSANNALEQEIVANYEVGSEIVENIKNIFGEFSEEPALTFESSPIFVSPWCESYEDEIFYKNTLINIAKIANVDSKIKSLLSLLILTKQPKESPFYKKQNIRGLSNYITTLLYRYISSKKGSISANTMIGTITKLVQDLERCVDIFDNRRLKT